MKCSPQKIEIIESNGNELNELVQNISNEKWNVMEFLHFGTAWRGQIGRGRRDRRGVLLQAENRSC